jgi:nanoRNase/pAp phosphatase (c-di-AMP/oligoRNAs hydrolase)
MISSEQQIFNQIERAKNILITFPIDWNGDALASALAFYLFLKKMGKNAEIVAAKVGDNKSEVFNFLPGFFEVKNSLDNIAKFIVSLDITNAKVDQIKYVVNKNTLDFIISPKEGWFTKDDVRSATSGYKYDLVIALGTSDLESLGKIYDNNVDFFYKTTIVNIDHHPGNEEFGQVNFIELNAVATAEILFEFLKDYRADFIDEDIATCLLTGIIYKTKSFKTPNLTPHALATTSELIRLGARREEIVNHLYRSRDIKVLKLWGRVLNNLQGSGENRLVWSTLFKNDFDMTGSNEESLLEVVDELIINIPQAKIIILFYSTSELNLVSELDEEDKAQTAIIHTKDQAPQFFATKAVVYAVKNINALDLVKEFNPTGTRKTAHIDISQPLKTASEKIISLINSKLDKLAL